MGRNSARVRRNAVRVARMALGMTQAELACEVGVTRQTVVAVEAGDYAPSVYLALAIAGRLEWSATWATRSIGKSASGTCGTRRPQSDCSWCCGWDWRQ